MPDATSPALVAEPTSPDRPENATENTMSSLMASFGGVARPELRADGKQILLVEDDEADIYLIMQALRTNPKVNEVICVRDGVEALEWIDTHRPRPDLAIVDLRMPRKDGLQLLYEMSARVTVDFPAIVLTSSSAPEDMVRSKRRGATQFITKPATLGELTRALNGVIDAL